MKKIPCIKILVLLLLVLVSCQKKKNSGFNYNISGILEDSTVNGLEISLVIPSQGIDKRIKTKILNEKFGFSGFLENQNSLKFNLNMMF
jgi:hypothetical protein